MQRFALFLLATLFCACGAPGVFTVSPGNQSTITVDVQPYNILIPDPYSSLGGMRVEVQGHDDVQISGLSFALEGAEHVLFTAVQDVHDDGGVIVLHEDGQAFSTVRHHALTDVYTQDGVAILGFGAELAALPPGARVAVQLRSIELLVDGVAVEVPVETWSGTTIVGR